jgi:ABC-type transport system substrate-binding protein
MGHRDNYWLRKAQGHQVSRRRFVGGVAIAGAGAATLGIVGCGDDDDDGGAQPTGPTPTSGESSKPVGGVSRAVWLGGSTFDSVDVHRNWRDETSWISNYVLNKIIRYSNPDAGVLEGDLAETWETPDGQSYTFNLRKDVKWQETALTNGRALTSQDIKWHIERQAGGKLSDGTEAPFRFQSDYRGIQVETPDDYTVKLKLPRPNGAFLTRIAAYFANVPNRETVEKFEKNHNTLTEEAMPATGPFTLKQWRTGKDIIVQRNPAHFRQGEPLLDGWITPWGLFDDPNAARLAFEQKQIDFWASPDSSVTKAVLDSHKDQMYEVLTGVANTVYLHLNMNKQFKDVRLVQAMNMAIDRRLMIQTFHQGLGQVSGPVTWLQDGFAVKPDDLNKYQGYRTDRDAEIKDARALWAAGGGPALGDVDVKAIDTWLGPWPDTSQILQSMLNQNLGVSQIKSTRGTYNEDVIPNLAKGEWPNWMAWTSQVNSPDPRNDLFASFHSTGSANFQKVNNPELDKLLEEAMMTADVDKAKETVLKAQDILLKNGQYGNVILYNYMYRTAVWKYFRSNYKEQGGNGRPAIGYNLAAGHLVSRNTYIDPKDPSYSNAVKNRTL